MIEKDAVRKNLYDAVNADWHATAEIAADKVTTGGFNDLADGVEKTLMADGKKLLDGEITPRNNYEEEYLKYYRLATDFDKRQADAAEPAQASIASIQALENVADLQEVAVDFTLQGLPLPFAAGVMEDLENVEVNGLHLTAISTILPDKTYYAEGNEAGPQLLAVYSQATHALLPLFGFNEEETADLVEKTLAFDQKIVPIVRSSEENADFKNMNNPRTLEEVVAYSENFDFKTYILELIGQEPEKVNVIQPNFYENIDSLINDDIFAELKAWLIVNYVYSTTNYLSEEIRQVGGQYNLILTGQPEMLSQDKAAFYLAKGQFSQVVGNYYGETYFGPEAREDVRQMVETMKDVYAERLAANTWISPETAEKAVTKVKALGVFVGYPDYYPPHYDLLVVDENLSLYENYQKLNRATSEHRLGLYGKEVDKLEWGMPADMVNAYFNPTKNHICFPAAILQEPFYSLEQGHSKNYGGIGGVMAHEISHAFDNNGALFDSKGNMANWWKDEDYAAFEEKTKLVIEQYDGLETPAGPVNGKLTVSENIADLGGLTCALESLQREEDYSLEEFFENWARVWRQEARPEYQALLLNIDVHAPTTWRANMVPQNLDAFHETYNTQDGDPMYLAPEDRVEIW